MLDLAKKSRADDLERRRVKLAGDVRRSKPGLADRREHCVRSTPEPSSYRATTPTIAIVDSGIDKNRRRLRRRRPRHRGEGDHHELVPNSPGDGRGHGTFVAGIAAGSAPGNAGAAPAAKLVSLDVMNDNGMARTSDVIAAVEWIYQNRATVQHPRRELVAPLDDAEQLHEGSARQGGGEALVRRRDGRRRVRELRQRRRTERRARSLRATIRS